MYYSARSDFDTQFGFQTCLSMTQQMFPSVKYTESWDPHAPIYIYIYIHFGSSACEITSLTSSKKHSGQRSRSSLAMAIQSSVLVFLASVVVAAQALSGLRQAATQKSVSQGACSTNTKFNGGTSWKGNCMSLQACQAKCIGSCAVFNWWPKRGGCRTNTAGYTESTTSWTSVGGAPDCTAPQSNPTCEKCPAAAGCRAAGVGWGWCGNGVQNPTSNPTKCCASSCGTCGGSACGSRDGGKFQCCHGFITETCTTTDQTGCVVPSWGSLSLLVIIACYSIIQLFSSAGPGPQKKRSVDIRFVFFMFQQHVLHMAKKCKQIIVLDISRNKLYTNTTIHNQTNMTCLTISYIWMTKHLKQRLDLIKYDII